MFEKLKKINEKLIILNKNNMNELKKQQIIKKILKEKDCFFKMSIETSFSILKDLNIKDEELRTVYQELIDSKNFI